MEDTTKIIDSGQLELFVYGVLPEDEMQQIAEAVQQNSSLQKEVEEIEQTVLHLSRSVSSGSKPENFVRIYQQLKQNDKVIPLQKKNYASFFAWAAVILLLVGIFWMFQQKTNLDEQLQQANIEKEQIENRLVNAEVELEDQNKIIAFIRNNDVQMINLPANEAVTQTASAKVFYNEKEQIAYLDLQGLPEPPEGMVYQVWSLLMQPLTPRSIGVMDEFSNSKSKLFEIKNIPTAEAFGITLEPKGGSESPTLENLYVLGTV